MTARKKADPPPAHEAPTLPHNLEAERSVLGAILVHNQAYDQVPFLQPKMFYRRAHDVIFGKMMDLRERKVEVDFITLREELTQAGKMDECGGPAYISSLADGVPRATNVRYYAQIVQETWTRREIIYAADVISTAAYVGEASAPEVLSDADRRFLALQQGGDRGAETMAHAAKHLFSELEWRYAHKGELRGLNTGFSSINNLTLGLRHRNFDVFAARPSMGKSTLTSNMSVHIAQSARTATDLRIGRVVEFSLEMAKEQVWDRKLAQISQVPLSRIQTGYLGGNDFTQLTAAIETLSNLPITVIDQRGLSAVDIRRYCRREIAEHGYLDEVIVDYIQLTRPHIERKGATRSEELSHSAQALQEMAGELGVHVSIVSQLRRTQGSRPTIEDLRDCGALEQLADMVALLHRKNHRESGPTFLYIDKQRNGPTGTCKVMLDRDTVTFTDDGEQTATEEADQAHAEQAEHAAKGRRSAFAGRARKAN